jgi:hypothetical protein
VSWPRTIAQEPINIGDANYDPLFPYGYGLRTLGNHYGQGNGHGNGNDQGEDNHGDAGNGGHGRGDSNRGGRLVHRR